MEWISIIFRFICRFWYEPVTGRWHVDRFLPAWRVRTSTITYGSFTITVISPWRRSKCLLSPSKCRWLHYFHHPNKNLCVFTYQMNFRHIIITMFNWSTICATKFCTEPWFSGLLFTIWIILMYTGHYFNINRLRPVRFPSSDKPNFFNKILFHCT